MMLLFILILQAPLNCMPQDYECRFSNEQQARSELEDQFQDFEREVRARWGVKAEVAAALKEADDKREGFEVLWGIAQSVVALTALGGAGKLTVDRYRK